MAATGRRLGTTKRNSHMRNEQNTLPETTVVAVAASENQSAMPRDIPRISGRHGLHLSRSSNRSRMAPRGGSDPSSSNGSSARSDSKRTSSDISEEYRVAEDRRNRSNAPSPDDLSQRPISTDVNLGAAFYQRKGARNNGRHGNIRPRRKPKRLNLSFVPKPQLNAIAYREGSLSPLGRVGHRKALKDTHSTHQFRLARTHVGRSQRTDEYWKATKRPSPKSLREARLRRLSQIQATQSHSELESIHEDPQRTRFASYVSTPERSRSNKELTLADTTSPPKAKLNAASRRPRADVKIRLSNLPVYDIARYARDGYVVDIVSSFIVRGLPMSRQTRDVAKQYIRWGQAQIATGIVNIEHRQELSGGSPWQQWAYISRLNMAEIGRDGRRRTLTSVDDVAEEESWTVILVPLREAQAEGLREELLKRQTGGIEANRRRQSLGSDIANGIKSL